MGFGKPDDRLPVTHPRGRLGCFQCFLRMLRMKREQRIEHNRQLAILQQRADRAVEWALVESFGINGFKAAYQRCLEAIRFPALASLAINTPRGSECWPQVVAFAKLLANNPRSRSFAYKNAAGCKHESISLPSSGNPDAVCAGCGATIERFGE
jgi:hypothetical protein